MKRFFKVFLFLLLAYVLATRFISIENPENPASPDPYPCRTDTPTPGGPIFPCSILENLNQSYLQEIKPIFEKKCLMCHGIAKTLPLYARIPPTSWLVQLDQREATEHVNMTYDFPFRGEHDLPETLEHLIKVVDKNSMPPLIYKIMHWQSGLTPEEKSTIKSWANQAFRTLQPGQSPQINNHHEHPTHHHSD